MSIVKSDPKSDSLGRRIEKTINGLTIGYLYDGQDIVQEMENGRPSVIYIRTLDIDKPLARINLQMHTVRYYHADALGSIMGLSDESGREVTQYAYDPFGNVTIYGEIYENPGSGHHPADHGPPPNPHGGRRQGNPFQYTGRENDGTGLYYYRARCYSAELQRFISEDPILKFGNPNVPFMTPFLLKAPEMLNAYNYTGNNPVNENDPTGLFSLKLPHIPQTPQEWYDFIDSLKCKKDIYDKCNNLQTHLFTGGGPSGIHDQCMSCCQALADASPGIVHDQMRDECVNTLCMQH